VDGVHVIQAVHMTPPGVRNWHFTVSLDASLYPLPFEVARSN